MIWSDQIAIADEPNEHTMAEVDRPKITQWPAKEKQIIILINFQPNEEFSWRTRVWFARLFGQNSTWQN